MSSYFRRRRAGIVSRSAKVLIGVYLLLIQGSAVVARAQESVSPPADRPEAPIGSSLAALRQAAERGSGARFHRGTWWLRGSARMQGADQKFTMVFDSRYRFRMAVTGDLPETDAFDGAICWTSGPAGVAHRIVLEDRDSFRLVAWTIEGIWAEPKAALLLTAATAKNGELAVVMKPRDGVLSGTLVLDAATFLPKSLSYGTSSGVEIWTFAGYRSFGGRLLPTHILHRSSGHEDVIDIASADTDTRDAAGYEMPGPNQENFSFDATQDSRIEVKSVAGLIFVHPRVDGQDVGWFFLDTGAEDMCIDPSVVKRLSLLVVGEDTVAGVVAVNHLKICRATTFQLGPATLKSPVFLALNLAPIAQALKIPVVGICGYDFIAKTELDIDMAAGSIRVFQPGSAVFPPDMDWTPIRFATNTPCLTCSFADGHRGIFSLDTGSTSTVDFFTPAVKKYRLLSQQDGTRGLTGGAGGMAESRQGKIGWFELGRIRIQSPLVGLQLTRQGAFASPYRDGNIGMGFLGKFRLLLDYQNERIAFVERRGG